jgi:hypothetical protein
MTALEAHIMTLSQMWHEPFFCSFFPADLSGPWITLRRYPSLRACLCGCPIPPRPRVPELCPSVIRGLEESSELIRGTSDTIRLHGLRPCHFLVRWKHRRIIGQSPAADCGLP